MSKLLQLLGAVFLITLGSSSVYGRGFRDPQQERAQQRYDRYNAQIAAGGTPSAEQNKTDAENYIKNHLKSYVCSDSFKKSVTDAFEKEIVRQNDAWRKPLLRDALKNALEEYCK